MKLSEIIAAYERGEVIEFKSHKGDWCSRNIRDDSVHWVTAMCDLDRLRIQPTPEQIDLSCLAGQQVLCEFWDSNPSMRVLGWLASITDKTYLCANEMRFYSCRPLLNYPQVYTGQTFPEGLVVEYGCYIEHEDVIKWNPEFTPRGCAVVAFKITDIKEGYTL